MAKEIAIYCLIVNFKDVVPHENESVPKWLEDLNRKYEFGIYTEVPKMAYLGFKKEAERDYSVNEIRNNGIECMPLYLMCKSKDF